MLRFIIVFGLGFATGVFGPFGCVHKVLDTTNSAVEKAEAAKKKVDETKKAADTMTDKVKKNLH
jgi:hypothetical protein